MTIYIAKEGVDYEEEDEYSCDCDCQLSESCECCENSKFKVKENIESCFPPDICDFELKNIRFSYYPSIINVINRTSSKCTKMTFWELDCKDSSNDDIKNIMVYLMTKFNSESGRLLIWESDPISQDDVKMADFIAEMIEATRGNKNRFDNISKIKTYQNDELVFEGIKIISSPVEIAYDLFDIKPWMVLECTSLSKKASRAKLTKIGSKAVKYSKYYGIDAILIGVDEMKRCCDKFEEILRDKEKNNVILSKLLGDQNV